MIAIPTSLSEMAIGQCRHIHWKRAGYARKTLRPLKQCLSCGLRIQVEVVQPHKPRHARAMELAKYFREGYGMTKTCKATGLSPMTVWRTFRYIREVIAKHSTL